MVQVPYHITHKDIYFSTIIWKSDSTAEDSKYVQQKNNIDKSEK